MRHFLAMKKMNREQQIRRYGEQLTSLLGRSLGVVSAGAVALPRSLYRESLVARWRDDPTPDADLARSARAAGAGPMESSRMALPEREFFAEWLQSPAREPLLLLGPVGAGKSCLIESLALVLAEELRHWSALDRAALPYVPIVAPLRFARGDFPDSLRDSAAQLIRRSTSQGDFPLSNDLIEALQSEGKAVYLLDGFDELPALDAGHVRRHIARLAGETPVLLASRPGHGAEDVVGHRARHYTIEPLSPEEVNEYVSLYVTEYRGAGSATSAEARECLEHARSGQIREAVRRPLYLRAWCDHWWARRAAPATQGDLHWRQFITCVSQRGTPIFESTTSPLGPQEALVEELADWIGELGCQFASRDFASISRDDPAIHSLLIKGRGLRVGENTYSLVTLAHAAGFLVYDLGERLVSMPKVFLVEYLIARHLARRAEADVAGKRVFIEHFRRWIWRRSHQNLLDHLFDVLWHGGQGQRDLARDLLTWIVRVGQCDSLRVKTSQEVADSDLIYPFALSALRWFDLDPSPTMEERQAIQVAVQETMLSLASTGRLWMFIQPYDGPPLSKSLISALLRRMAGHIVVHSRSLFDSGISPSAKLVERACAADAASLFREWLSVLKNLLARQTEQGYSLPAALILLRSALREASSRLPEQEVPGVLAQLIPLPDSSSRDPNLWDHVLAAIGQRVSSRQALPLLSLQIPRLAAAPECDQLSWRWFVEGACEGLHEEDAAALVAAAIEQHNDLQHARDGEGGGRDDFSSLLWRTVIEKSARRLAPSVAIKLAKRAIASRGKISDRQRLSQLAAMSGACARLPSEQARGVINTLLDQQTKVQAAHEIDLIRAGIIAAAGRLPGSDVPAAIDQLRSQGKVDALDGVAFRQIAAAAGRADECDAERLLEQFMEAHQRAKETPHQLDWREPIAQAAKRMSPRGAETSMRKWLTMNAKRDRRQQEAICAALEGVARQVRSEETAFLVELALAKEKRLGEGVFNIVANLAERFPSAEARRWVNQWLEQARKHPERKDSYRRIARAAANCVPASEAHEVCAMLLRAEESLAACRMAVESGTIGIRSERVAAGSDNGAKERVRLVPFERSGMILDEPMRCAPAGIRKLIAAGEDLDSNQRLLLQALATAAAKARRMRADQGEWLSMSPWFTAAGVTRQRVNHQELIAGLIRLELVEVKTAGKWTHYRITPTGSDYLSRLAEAKT
jgi:hypothetical protein